MTRLCAFVVLVLWHSCNVLTAAEPAPQVELKIATPGDIWQGQRVTFNITIKTPDIFASAPAFDLPQVRGAILIPPQGPPIVGTDTVGDDTFTTQTHELNVFPQHAGTLTIPPFSVRFDSNAGFGKPVHARTVTTTAVSLPVKRPPGTDTLALVLTTTQFSVKESWKPEPGADIVAVGAAFTRTIQIDADNLPGLVLPSFHTPLPEGLHDYPREPLLNDQDNRGSLTGHRTETITIVCERPGHYELPALKVSWWNPEEQQLHEARLPGHTIMVTAPPSSETSNQVASTSAAVPSRSSLLFAIVVLLGSIGGLCWYWPSLKKYYHRYTASVAASEPSAFRAVSRACHVGEPRAVYQAILTWRDKFQPATDRDQSLQTIDFKDDPGLLNEWQLLESCVYGVPDASGEPSWSPHRLLTRLTHYRAEWRRESRIDVQLQRLPALNPQSGVATHTMPRSKLGSVHGKN